MKRFLLLALASASTLSAEISYKNLYAQTALVGASVALAGYGLSKLCRQSENVPWVQNVGVCLAAIVAGSYYTAMHPETRMKNNEKSFKASLDSHLFSLLLNSDENATFKKFEEKLISQISLTYLESENTFYNAFEDIMNLKKQFGSILEESHLLLNFYNFYKNDSYCAILEYQIGVSQKAIELITQALIVLKNSQEYKDAMTLQLQIENNKHIRQMAFAQQTQAFNNYRPYTNTIIVTH